MNTVGSEGGGGSGGGDANGSLFINLFTRHDAVRRIYL